MKTTKTLLSKLAVYSLITAAGLLSGCSYKASFSNKPKILKFESYQNKQNLNSDYQEDEPNSLKIKI